MEDMKLVFFQLRAVAISVALMVVVGVAVAGCRSTAGRDLQAVGRGKAAPSFTLKDSAGKAATLDDYRGKVVLLDFWATWCHGCKEEIPWFAEFQRKYGPKGFEVVGVSMDDDWKTVHEFLAQTDVPYRIVLGDATIMDKYGNTGMPDTFLIDRQGKIAAVYRGLVNKDGVEKDLQAVLVQQ
jgi:cytochrome c biogenesis protein CcmG/thiol:disulfide interchange protein DsbE